MFVLKALALTVALAAATSPTNAARLTAPRGLQQQQPQQLRPTPVPSFSAVSGPPTTNWYVAAEAPDYNNAVHAEFLQSIQRVRRPGERYAVFDWDNTCMYGDISYTSVFYQMDTLAYRIPPNDFERLFALGYTASTSDACFPLGTLSVLGKDVNGANVTLARALASTAADYRVLYDAYIAPTYNLSVPLKTTASTLTLAQVRETLAFQNFRAKIAFLTFGLEASYGAQDRLPCAMRVGMTVFPQLLVGMTDAEIRALIRASVRWNLGAKLETLSFTSNADDLAVQGDYSTGLRVFNGQETVMRSLRAVGTDVYVISASPQVFVEEVGHLLGLGFLVPSPNVFGVRFTFDRGLFTGHLVPTTTYPITWGPGKAAIVETVLKPRYRYQAPVYASGDSDGDCDMLATVRDGVVHVNNRLKDASTCIQAFYERSCQFFRTKEPGTNNKYLLQGQDKALGSWIPSGFSTKDGVAYTSSATSNNACVAYKFLQ